jgi:hypothetical protein
VSCWGEGKKARVQGWQPTPIQYNDFEFSGAVKTKCCVVGSRTKTTAQKKYTGAKKFIFYPKCWKRDNLGKRGSLGNHDFNPVPKQNETKRNETKRNETKRNETKRNETIKINHVKIKIKIK